MCIKPLTGYKNKEGKIELVKKEILKEAIWRFRNIKEFKERVVLIKCGKCRECLKNKIAEITKRIKKEATFWEKNIVATFTFNEENKKETFEDVEKELQKFFKRLRKKHKIRYFAAIEKGEQKERLHAHIIIFNYKPEDAIFYKKSKKGSNQYTSKELNKLWGKGIVTFEELNAKSINYVIKYMFKKDKAVYHWSKKPPLGISEKENLEKLKKDIENGKQLPKCYKNYTERKTGEKIELNEKAKQLKELFAEEKIKNIEEQSKMNYREYIQNKLKKS